ncbi:MAG: formylglycine-generating enzyme family protein [Pedosphaera sp.]|nr:formylglycine-generating enzyme family protein [Pedosphaera sp.]
MPSGMLARPPSHHVSACRARRVAALITVVFVAVTATIRCLAAPQLEIREETTTFYLACTSDIAGGMLYVRGATEIADIRFGRLLDIRPGEVTGYRVPLDTNTLPSGSAIAFFRLEHVVPPPAPSSNLVWIPPGTYTLGSPPTESNRDENEGPETVVTLTQDFWMARHETTQGEFLEIMETNPSFYSTNNGFADDRSRPVESVSWHMATNYCGRLTALHDAAGILPPGMVYRLPTEMEWEYACRAGTTTTYSFGWTLRKSMANFNWSWEHDGRTGWINRFDQRSSAGTVPVEQYAPNAFGLYDMHGNVFEWVSNGHFNPLPGGHITDFAGPTNRIYRVSRGGSWFNEAWHSRSANRSISIQPFDQEPYSGFRVVLARPLPPTVY